MERQSPSRLDKVINQAYPIDNRLLCASCSGLSGGRALSLEFDEIRCLALLSGGIPPCFADDHYEKA